MFTVFNSTRAGISTRLKTVLLTASILLLTLSFFLISTPAIAGQAPGITADYYTPEDDTTDIPVDSVIQVRFSAIIDFSTITSASFIVEGVDYGGISGTFSGEGTDTITFTPDYNLPYDVVVSVRLTTDITDLSAVHLNQETQWSFTVESEPVPPLPESSTLVLAGSGLIVLAAWLFFRHKRQPVTTV